MKLAGLAGPFQLIAGPLGSLRFSIILLQNSSAGGARDYTSTTQEHEYDTRTRVRHKNPTDDTRPPTCTTRPHLQQKLPCSSRGARCPLKGLVGCNSTVFYKRLSIILLQNSSARGSDGVLQIRPFIPGTAEAAGQVSRGCPWAWAWGPSL